MNLENLSPAGLDIKVLGTGCAKCKTLEKLTKQAIDELGIEATVEKVEDMRDIMQYGVMRTPGLVINGKVVLSGSVPKLSSLKETITENK